MSDSVSEVGKRDRSTETLDPLARTDGADGGTNEARTHLTLNPESNATPAGGLKESIESGAEARDDGHVQVKLSGPGVTIEDAFKAGLDLKQLLGTIAEHLGAPKGAAEWWQVTAVHFMCDGCGLRRPDRPRADEGWTFVDGDDLCPACSGVSV